jgi:hypothetical protein
MAIRRVVVVDREAPPHTEVRFLFGKKPGEKTGDSLVDSKTVVT